MMIEAITLAACRLAGCHLRWPVHFFPWSSATLKKWPHVQARPFGKEVFVSRPPNFRGEEWSTYSTAFRACAPSSRSLIQIKERG